MDPRRKSAAVAQTPATSLRKRAAARTTAGRWSLLCEPHAEGEGGFSTLSAPSAKVGFGPGAVSAATIERAKREDAALDAHARILLCRYGVLFRDLLARESNAPKWRDLLPILRRLEARGEIRGGRFVSGPFGEQYALPEAVDSLRAARREAAARATEAPIVVAAADPLNLVGIIVPGERVPAIPGREVSFCNGAVTTDEAVTPIPKPRRTRSIADLVRADAITPRAAQPTASPGLFQ